MPFCGACAYAFPKTDTRAEDRPAGTLPATPTDFDSSPPPTLRPEPPQGRPPTGWWTPTRILVAFGIVVGVLFAGGLSQRADAYGALAYVLLNPILWVAAALAAVFLFRQGRGGLAGGVLGLTMLAVLGFVGPAFFWPQVAPVAPHSEPPISPVRTPTPLELCLEDKINARIDEWNAEHPERPKSHRSAPFSQLDWQLFDLNSVLDPQAPLNVCRTLLGIETPPPNW
jgi:hypothetical protein